MGIALLNREERKALKGKEKVFFAFFPSSRFID
jgi:hypothetical protein